MDSLTTILLSRRSNVSSSGNCKFTDVNASILLPRRFSTFNMLHALILQSSSNLPTGNAVMALFFNKSSSRRTLLSKYPSGIIVMPCCRLRSKYFKFTSWLMLGKLVNAPLVWIPDMDSRFKLIYADTLGGEVIVVSSRINSSKVCVAPNPVRGVKLTDETWLAAHWLMYKPAVPAGMSWRWRAPWMTCCVPHTTYIFWSAAWDKVSSE